MSEHSLNRTAMLKSLESLAVSCGFRDLTHLKISMLRARAGECPSCGRPLETSSRSDLGRTM